MDRNEGEDQTEGLTDAPGPLVYADTDVPQIPDADHFSFIFSTELSTAWSLCQGSFLSLFPHTDKPKNTLLSDIHTSTHYCHTHTASNSKNYRNYLPSEPRAALKADQDQQEVSLKSTTGPAQVGTDYKSVLFPLFVF